MRTDEGRDRATTVWVLQGIYYLITGIWAVFGVKSFQKVIGPQVDIWLLKTVAALVTVIGGVLTSAGLRREQALEIPALAVGSALGLGGIGTFYSLRGRISKVFLLEAATEFTLVGLWLVMRRSNAK